MSVKNIALVETAAQIIADGFVLPPLGAGKRATLLVSPIDMVSPLTVAEARRLLFAHAVAELLSQLGYDVVCHGLLADDDLSVKNLTLSVWLRYLELCGEAVAYPNGCYQGDYIFDFAATVHRTYGDRWRVAANEVASWLTHAPCLDDTVRQIQARLGNEALHTIKQIGLHAIDQDIANDVRELGMTIDEWPRASELRRDGTVTAAIHRLEANALVRTDKRCRYITLPPADQQANTTLIENQAGPTPMAVGFSHFLSVLGNDRLQSDLNICVCDINEVDSYTLFNRCARLLGNPDVPMTVASMTIKPISCPQLLELGELVHTSPLAEDFVSFREARQTIGLDNVRWIFGIQQSGEAMTIDLDDKTASVSMMQNAVIADEDCEVNRVALALNGLPANHREHAEAFLRTITEYHDIVNQTMRWVEPALLLDYYRKLCESFLSYYNNHQLMAHASKVNTTDNGALGNSESLDELNCSQCLLALMTRALQRLEQVITPLIFARHVTQDSNE